MFSINVNKYSKSHNFCITGVSYIGKPLNNTAMFITKKVENLLSNLSENGQYLVFAEETVLVPEKLLKSNVFVFSKTPQKEYADFVSFVYESLMLSEKNKKYTCVDNAIIGENVIIGDNTVIEPGAFVGHDVIIGKNSVIKSGAKIRNAIIGDNFIAGENCTVGTTGFTMTDDDNGNKIRIFTLGKVVIGNNVEVGALTNVSSGTAGNTVIEDFVKLDSLVHIGHDVHLHKNVEIPAGAIIGGFDELEEGSYVGINATLRNRIRIGKKAFVGMGAVVTKSVDDNVTVVGNPAKPFERK